MMFIYDIYVEHPFADQKTFAYTYHQKLEVGIRVRVPLQGRMVVGFIQGLSSNPPKGIDLKEIDQVIDDAPILNQELMDLAAWMSDKTLSPMIACYQAILPNQLRPSSTAHKAQVVDWLFLLSEEMSFTPKQALLIQALKQGPMLYSQALKDYKSIVKTLLNKGAIERRTMEKTYQPQNKQKTYQAPILTSQQASALAKIDLDQAGTYLLFGQTGSGKTEIYLHAAQKVLDNNKQVLILVPEISLTPQMIARFEGRFGKDIGIYHSNLSNQEKYEQYQRVKNKEVSIVVGTRSCVFLPFDNLGLIVLDEEHDGSFKQDVSPYYHAKDVAIYRSNMHHCPLILGSASPSLESYARASKGVYQLLELSQRINLSLPKTRVVDSSKSLLKLNYHVLSPELSTAIQNRLDKKEQVVLLLNRRSYSPIVQCSHCLKVLMCPHCETALAYHKDDQSYHCHTCGYQTKNNRCQACGHQAILQKGLGIQQLEEMVRHHFPGANVARLDTDNARKKNYQVQVLKDFNDHVIDILIGTQMIAKGLDNPLVTLVGILNIDRALMVEDYSTTEKVFQLVLQAAGRAGRHEKQGAVILQSHNPNHYAIQAGLNQDYLAFYRREMAYRHQGAYPPYTYLTEIMLVHGQVEKIYPLAQQLAAYLRQQDGLVVLGPVVLRRIQNRDRVRLVVKSRNLDQCIRQLHAMKEAFNKELTGKGLRINVNPGQLSL